MKTERQVSGISGLRRLAVALLAAGVIVAAFRGRVYAGGYEWAGLGSRAQSMGGAFIGKSDDWTAIYWNPAGLAQLKGSGFGFEMASSHVTIKDGSSLSNFTPGAMETRYQIDTFAQYTGIEPTRFGKDNVEYDFYFPSGAGGYWQAGEWTLGMGFYTPAGYYIDWNDTISYGAGSIYASLFQELGIHIGNFSAAKQVSETVSLGFGVNVLFGAINYKARKNVVGSMISDYRWGYASESDGFGVEGVFGLMKKVNEKLNLGLTYRTGATIDMDGDASTYLTLAALDSASKFDQDFRYPSTYGIGLAYQADPKLAVTADWQRTNWSEFDIDVDYSNPFFPIGDNKYSADWHDSNRYRVGLEYKASPKWVLRGGYFFDETPIPDKSVSLSNIAGVDRHNVLFGIGHEIRKNTWLDMVFHWAWGHREVNGVHYRQRINSLGLSMSFMF